MIKLGNYEITPTMFPDKTSQVWRIPEQYFTERFITWEFESEAELSPLIQLAVLYKEVTGQKADLNMPYLVYGRQDKDITNTSTFAKNAIMPILSQLFHGMYTLDAHSSDKWFVSTTPSREIGFCVAESNPEVICYPDKGASLRGYSNYFRTTINLDKARDQLTGEIIGLCITQDDADKVKDKRVLICDDICDGGRTFIEAAKVLKASGAESVCLYTTHGIYSKGTQVLFHGGLDRVFNRKGEVYGS